VEGLAEFLGPGVVDGELMFGFGGVADAAHEAFIYTHCQLVGLV